MTLYYKYMIHSSHGLRIYRRTGNVLITFGLLSLPILFIGLGGWITQISDREVGLALGISGYRLFIGYVISVVIALLCAVILGQGALGDFFIPVFDVIQNLPSFALIPIFALWLGYTNTMAISFAVSTMIWPILFYILTAIRTAKNDYNEAATIFGARGLRRLLWYILPISFPALVTGSIVAISTGWEAVIGIEIIGFSNGIGKFLNTSIEAHQHRVFMFGLVALLLIVFSVNKLIWLPLIKRTRLYGE